MTNDKSVTRRELRMALRKNDGDIAKTAEALGISEATVLNLMARLEEVVPHKQQPVKE